MYWLSERDMGRRRETSAVIVWALGLQIVLRCDALMMPWAAAVSSSVKHPQMGLHHVQAMQCAWVRRVEHSSCSTLHEGHWREAYHREE